MLPADGRCLASCPIDAATIRAATSVTSTDSDSAPPAYAAATASEVATPPPGAMNVTDWNTTPGSPIVCCARPVPAVAGAPLRGARSDVTYGECTACRSLSTFHTGIIVYITFLNPSSGPPNATDAASSRQGSRG